MQISLPNFKTHTVKVVKLVSWVPSKYCDGVAIVTHNLVKTIASAKKVEKNVISTELKEKENFLEFKQKKKNKLKIKRFIQNSSLFLARNQVFFLIPIAVGVMGIILVKPLKVIAQEYGEYIDLDHVEYKEPSPTFYQRFMKAVVPAVIPSANLVVNTTAIINTSEFICRSYWNFKNANYIDTFLNLTQIGLSTGTLAFGELSRRSNDPQKKVMYTALQRSTLALSTTVRLSDLW
jgi:hypothetical protein